MRRHRTLGQRRNDGGANGGEAASCDERLLLATRARTTSRSRGVGFVHGFEQCYGVFLAWPKTQKNDGGKLIYVGISSKTQSASLALAFSVSLALA